MNDELKKTYSDAYLAFCRAEHIDNDASRARGYAQYTEVERELHWLWFLTGWRACQQSQKSL